MKKILGKGSNDKQQSGGGDSARSKVSDEPGIKEKVRMIMDMTQRSEAEVCSALHDCDNDMELAANMLLENNTDGVNYYFYFLLTILNNDLLF